MAYSTKHFTPKIPSRIKGAIDRYVFDGIPPGHFLSAVIQNNLFEAINRADADSAKALRNIILYFYNETPGTCWGNPDRMLSWLSMDEAKRTKITKHF